MISEGDIVDLRVEDLGYGARGLARISSFVIWIDGAFPGDFVRARITSRKPNYALGKILEYLEYSERRVRPRCIHHETCRGCQLIALKYESQLEFKMKQLNDILKRIGRLDHVAMRAIVPSPEMFRYRNKMEFSFGSDAEGRFQVGLHLPGCHDRITGLRGCHLQSRTADRILRRCWEHYAASASPAVPAGSLDIRHLMIREGKNTGEFLVALTAPATEESIAREFATALAREFSEVRSFIFRALAERVNNGRMTIDRVFKGDGTMKENIGRLRFTLDCDSFFQANTPQAEYLLKIVHEFAMEQRFSSLLDLYCGSGSLSLSLSGSTDDVLGMDVSEASVFSAIRNAKTNGIGNCRYLCTSVERGIENLASSMKRFDLVIANPSRSGMSEKAISNIVSLMPPRMLYISCNPATLARDLALLKGSGYSLKVIVPLDMFPHTYHVESVSYLKKS